MLACASACTGNNPKSEPFAPAVAPAAPSAIPLAVVNLELAAPALTGGGASSGTITLSLPAPTATTVALSSSNAAAGVPPSITVPVGATTAGFVLATRVVTSDVAVTIGARLGSTTNVQVPLSVLAVLPTSFSWFSEPGEFIGGGKWGRNTPENGATFTASCDGGAVEVRVVTPDFWTLTFRAPSGAPLRPGTYENATSSPLSSPQPGLSVSGMSHGCTSTGRFAVQDVQLTAGGNVQRFSATFEQQCQSNQGPKTLAGEIRVTNVPVPFSSNFRNCVR